MKPSQEGTPKAPRELVITVSANFTAEPIADVLRFWMSRLVLGPTRLEFSGYNQIFQVLMAPDGAAASPPPGVHVLLVRFEDWARDQAPGSRAAGAAAAVHEFIPALKAFAPRAGRPIVVLLCPPSGTAAADPELARTLLALEKELRQAMAGLRGASLIAPDDVASLYPVDIVDDPESDRQGHIPFTPVYWTALGTALARKIHSLFHPPHKVIVVDADNTLWGGVVGELGARQVRLDNEWRVLQDFLRARKNQGLLLALASKNEVADVEEVFRRQDMVLRREDFVAWKVDWQPKSRNVQALAKELELGLDSFIFLDDNPVECADVAANCPAVTTLRLPSDPGRIPGFLRHAWAFDLDGATKVDEKRTELYQQQSERNQYRNAASSFREFIDGLQLRVDMAPPLPAQYDRAAQLTQRTNQFNTSGIRRTPAELGALLESGKRRALLVRARDRFGDYGEVGLAVFFADGGGLNIESLLMSCRALGKGVEHRLLAGLGEEARRLGLDDVVIPFKRTDRNLPAENFLKSVGAVLGDAGAYRLSSAAAAGAVFDPESGLPQEISAETLESGSGGRSRPDYGAIAELTSVEKIMNEMARHFRRDRPTLANELVRPRSSEEARLAGIWEEVLHIDPIGVLDPFLSLGGRSLQAASIASRIAAEFGVRVPLNAVFSTIAELSARIGRADRRHEDAFLPKARQAVLSPAQQRLWFLDQFIPNRAAYNIPLARRIHGRLNPGALESALSKVALRHELLRSTYGIEDGSTVLHISETPRVTLERLSADTEMEALAKAGEEARRPFDLTQGPLLRCLAISWGAEDHLLVINIQHIIADGWSTGILLSDLADAYAAELAGREPSWVPLPASYLDYAAWQQERLAAGDFRADLDFWKSELRAAPSLLELPTDKPRPSVMTYQGGSLYERIGPSVRRAVEVLAEREGCTPFMVLLAAWQALLYRYSGQDDIVVGVPVAGRSHASVEGLVGCFVNTLAVRTAVDGEAPFLGHLGTVRGKMLEALAHQDLPFELLVSELGLERDLSRSPLFQVMLVLQDTPKADFAPDGLAVTSVPLHNGGAKFDLVLEVTPAEEGYGLALEFNTSLFLTETAERMLRHFGRLLETACASPQTSLSSLPMMADDEVAEMLSFVNRKPAAFPDVECLHQGFERRVAMSPDAPALSCDGRSLSYEEVNRRANRLAHYLIACGVGPDVLVGLCIDRSPELVIAILGLLKAGGAYLPIDLSYPADRLAFMLDDAQAPVLLTEKKLLSSLPPHRARVICIDDSEAILEAQPATNPATSVTPDHMAYVIFTSGSTGKPKGCMITHRNVARLMKATENWYGFGDRDVWTLFHSTAFDFSVWEIWGALLYGGRLVVVPFMVSRSPEAFYELLAKEQVTVLNQTPSAFRQLIQAEESLGPKKLSLRYVIFGGEALEMQSLRPWFDRHGDQQPLLVNMYGITETTVHVTYRPLSRDDVRSASVIGIPLPDLQIYILDPHRRPVPIGVPGEIFVGGAGLARGYLRRPELTAERFIPNPFPGTPGPRLYRTGDRARFLPNRDIEYLGRVDDQVKIRGFRIELGEIESVLCRHPDVREASVMAREDGSGPKRLVAYLVTSRPSPEVGALREHLKKKLPEYMVPAVFMFLEKLPLTNNGKIDRKALPVPEQHRPDLGGRFVAPRTPAEKTLARIWSNVLRVEKVGIDDNFFALGGDSILSIQVISPARREGLKLTPTLLFKNQTVRELAAAAGTADAPESQGEAASGEVPLTPIQRWFFEQPLEERRHYNQAFMLEPAEKLDRPLLERALAEVSRHHDALRLRYVHRADGWRQSYSPSPEPASLSWVDLSPEPEEEMTRRMESMAASAQSRLDLENGPLWRAVYFDRGPGRSDRLLLVVHHLAVDGVSWRPLLEDLETAYQELRVGQSVQLPAKTASFKTWAERLGELAEKGSRPDESSFWETVTEAPPPTPAILPPVDPEAAAGNTEGSSVTLKVSLGAEETRALIQDVPAVYNTQINDVLLTGLGRAWQRLSGSRALFTNLEGHGREDLFDDLDLSRTVGWFTSIFPVRLELPETGSDWEPGRALKSVKEQLRRIPGHGIGYGILRYLTAKTDLAARPEPAMIFNYLGQYDRILAGSKLFRMARENNGPWHSPRQRRRYLLEINGLVSDGHLELVWTYNPGLTAEAVIRKLADEFIAALKELIRHCQAPGVGGRTPSDFPLAGLSQAALDGLLGGRRDVEEIYPLSPIQMLFYSANPGSAQSAFDQWQCTLRGELNEDAFRKAWQETLQRHPVLRTTIHDEGLSEPVQIVHREVRPPWTVEDWRNRPPAQRAERWSGYLEQDRARPLMLTEAPVMRFALIRWDDQTWKFLWSIPALLLDGWSWPVVFRDVGRLYEAYSGRTAPSFEPARPYRDYIQWLGRHSFDEARAFWRASLAGFREPTPLPGDAPDPAADGERYLEIRLPLSAETTGELQTAARRLQITLSTLVQGAWGLLLGRQSGRSDVVLGAAFAARPADLPGVESIVGPFVNNLPVRISIPPDAIVGDYLRGLQARSLELSPFQFTPLMEIQSLSEVPWRHRLFDSLVVFQNYAVDDAARRFGGGLEISDFTGPLHTHYPLMLVAEPGAALGLTLVYDRRSLARATAESWGRDVVMLLERMPAHLEKPLAELLSPLSPPPAVARPPKLRLSAPSQNYMPPQTALERTIADLWQSMFDVERVGVEENFFELGGYSSLLVQMHARLREILKIDLPIVSLFEHPTVRSLARHLARADGPAPEAGRDLRDRAQRQKKALAQMKNRKNK